MVVENSAHLVVGTGGHTQNDLGDPERGVVLKLALGGHGAEGDTCRLAGSIPPTSTPLAEVAQWYGCPLSEGGR